MYYYFKSSEVANPLLSICNSLDAVKLLPVNKFFGYLPIEKLTNEPNKRNINVFHSNADS
ncbi:MAG: hypothetical protein IPJ45_17895 [Ignavibacteria bacterium]|nr:hypothetical protein [Ignavibacteria bacterium]